MFQKLITGFGAIVASLLFLAGPSMAAEFRVQGSQQEGVMIYSIPIPRTAAVNDISAAIPACQNMTVWWEQGNSGAATLYPADSDDDSVAEVEANTAITSFSTNTKYGPFTPTKAFVRFVVDTVNATVPSTAKVLCSNLATRNEPGAAYGLVGNDATWSTVGYLSSLKTFQGLDQTIPWSTFYIDPYRGSDAATGDYEDPIRSIGEWKRRAAFGSRFVVKNGRQGRPMYFSNQTFPYTITSGTCVIGEQISHNTTHDSEVLDIDYDAQVIVVRSLTATSLASSTAFTGDSSGCSWTTGTRDESLIGNAASLVCETDARVACSSTADCSAAGFTDTACVVDSVAGINFNDVPARYVDRVVSLLEREDPSQPVFVHGDSTSIGGASALGTGGGVFYSTTNTVATANHGCLGVAGIYGERIADDYISQTAEGCVRGLDVGAEVVNSTTAANLNVFTTHQGTNGHGGIAVVNGFGRSHQFLASSGGATGAFTGDAYAILLGTKEIILDADILTSSAGTAIAPVVSSGGNVTMIGHKTVCDNVGTFNCEGFDLLDTSTSSASRTVTLQLIRNVFSAVLPNVNTPIVDIIPSTANPVTARIYRPTFDGAGNAIRFSGNAARVTLDVRGAIFERELNFYLLDAGSSATNVTLSVEGVYDEHTGAGNTNWFTAAGTFTTVAALLANPTVASAGWSVHQGPFSIQTDVTNEVATNGTFQCLSAGECWDSYEEAWTVPFPVPLYDYLPTPIYGYTEFGRRSYGAR